MSKIDELNDELTKLVSELDQWYDIGKAKWYVVEVYNKGSIGGAEDNVFDIFDDEIAYYDDTHKIPFEAMSTVIKIQDTMKKFNKLFDSLGAR